jgi:hypothetical protein
MMNKKIMNDVKIKIKRGLKIMKPLSFTLIYEALTFDIKNTH